MAAASGFSLSRGSEDVIQCSKCIGNVSGDAEQYCKDCREHLCSKCITDHDKWTANRSHTLVSSYDRSQHVGQTLTETCHIHKGKLIERFCAAHDAVFCSTCEIVDHGSCKIDFIINLSNGYKESVEFGEILQSTNNLLKNLKVVKANEEDVQSKIDIDLSSQTNEIQQARNQIRKHFDKIEDDAIRKVSSVHRMSQDATTKNVKNLERNEAFFIVCCA